MNIRFMVPENGLEPNLRLKKIELSLDFVSDRCILEDYAFVKARNNGLFD